jgi:hypothetical protein
MRSAFSARASQVSALREMRVHAEQQSQREKAAHKAEKQKREQSTKKGRRSPAFADSWGGAGPLRFCALGDGVALLRVLSVRARVQDASTPNCRGHCGRVCSRALRHDDVERQRRRRSGRWLGKRRCRSARYGWRNADTAIGALWLAVRGRRRARAALSLMSSESAARWIRDALDDLGRLASSSKE